MTKTAFRPLAILFTGLLIAGCASEPRSSVTGDTESRRIAEINTSLGREYMERGQYEIALEKLLKAVEQDSTYAPAHTVLAVLYERLGKIEEAGVEYQRAVRAAPDNGDVNNNYGVFLCHNNRSQNADRYFEHAVEDPFYRTPQVALANAGACAMQRGELDKAESFLRQSLEYDAEFADALLPMAGLSFQRRHYLRARAFLQRYEINGAPTAQSLTLGYRIETALDDTVSAQRYASELMERFPESIRMLEAEDQ